VVLNILAQTPMLHMLSWYYMRQDRHERTSTSWWHRNVKRHGLGRGAHPELGYKRYL